MEKKYVANKALLVNAQGKILLIRDSGIGDHENSKDLYDVPGGRMNKDETPLEGLVREVKEETGITIDASEIRPVHVDIWGVRGDVVNEPIIGIFYATEIGDMDVRLSDEHSELLWYDPRNAIPEQIKGSVRAAIEAYRQQEGILTASDASIQGRKGFGLVQIVTGNGKGKTTSALGQAMRAAAIGKRVGIVFFDKGGEHYSERKILDSIENIEYTATGRDRIDPKTGRFDFSINDNDREQASNGLMAVNDLFDRGFDLVVVDEVLSCCNLGIITNTDVMSLIDRKPQSTELILTGRGASEASKQKAHLVTEMRLVKHYFYSGVPAREGLDY